MRRIAGVAVLAGVSALTTGCGFFLGEYTAPVVPPVVEPNSCRTTSLTSPATPSPTSNFAGQPVTVTVQAGTTPVVGASVQMYAVGTTGNGSTPTALLSTPGTTNASGVFYFSGGFTCPLSNSVLYVVARGGQVGAGGAANSALVLTTALGTCSSVVNGATFTVNEATTVATAWGMAPFLSGESIGATASNSSGIALAAGTVANLANIQSGTLPGASFPGTGTAPVAKMNSAANLLNACAVGGAASAGCTKLFSLTASGSSTATDTFGAAVLMAKNPGANVSALYTQSATAGVYKPVLATAPSDWTMYVTYSGGGMNNPTAVSVDSTGKLWVANYFNTASLFTNTGAPVFATGIGSNNLYNSYGGAVDVNDLIWLTNEQSYYPANAGLGSISVLRTTGLAAAGYTSGGLNFPIAVSFDTSGVAWVVDYGNSHLTLLDGSGTPLSGTSGYGPPNFVFPVAVATDSKCNGYVANQSSNTVTQVFADGSHYTDFVVGQGPSGVAVDGSDYVWTANYYDDSVGLVSPAGKVLSSGGFKGGGIVHPQGIAVDGLGNVWVANYRGPALSELAASGATVPGKILSPSAGWAPDAGLLEAYGLAIDASGNVWVTNLGSNTLTEFVGMAAPVKTPLLGPVRVP